MTRLRVALACGLVALLAVVVAGLRLHQVHEAGGEWRLSPSPAPPTLVYGGRDYVRGNTTGQLPDGAEAAGTTWGGGVILDKTDEGDPHTPIVVHVEDDDGTVWTYELLGGP